MTTVDAASAAEAVIVIQGVYDAPRELVWKVFTDPKHVVHWYGGHGFTNPVCEMDVRKGGTWRHVMQAPDGSRFSIDSVFLEVTEPEKLVWTGAGAPNPHGPPTAVNTVTFEQVGKQTKWKLVARFDSIAERDRAVQFGFAQMVMQGTERLTSHLATL